ncbi:dynein heavy chain domain-containing protein 1 isoform X3 [Nematostella vectensis]|nr:dynein heavy chain domain-containing protein 1 isoform X3 [Nematostella vectensis]XP_048580283.1 dynein heavy chain domain-containing protein 1 isoform X3 [Nematostella vectensis]
MDEFNSSLVSARGDQTSLVELCVRQKPESSLVVEGKQVQQQGIQRSPLTRQKLQDTLFNDDRIHAALHFHDAFVADAITEVQDFCDGHAWLSEIHAFVTMWDDSKMGYWRGQPTSKIEQQLHQIHSWTEQVCKVIKSFSTNNGLLHLDCESIHNTIIPKLGDIFKQMVTMVASHVLVLSDEVVLEVEQLSECIREQKLDIRGFACFIQKLEKVKARMPALKEKVEYIKNLFEVIRSCYRQLSPEEEVTEEKVWAMWEAFLFGLQEASDFVQVQRAQVTERMVEEITALEVEASTIGRKARTGPFLDPNENPTAILVTMRQMRDRFYTIRSKLNDISDCKRIITGSPYDMRAIQAIGSAMERRQELWRYCETSSHTIKDWLLSPFNKVNVKRAIEKVNEWISAGISLKEHLPANDAVLTSWLGQLEEFIQDLPLLLKLSSDALKPRHWRALFIGIGQEFDSTMQFTTATLLSFNLGRYKDLIVTVCAAATKEHALELQLQQLTKSWHDKDFKLAKHIPILRPRFTNDASTRTPSQKKNRRNKLLASGKSRDSKMKPKTPSSVPDLYILIGVGELKCMIEDNLVTLKLMQVSPYVADLKPTVDAWIASLHTLEDILDIWADAQKKWLYLSNVFSEPKIHQQLSQYLDKLSLIDSRYKELMQIVLKDTKVLSVLSMKRGEKGWRELQGEPLRNLLLELIQSEEELIKRVRDYIHQTRLAFPRLFFMSDDALLSMLAWSRNPKDLVPFVRKSFPAIRSLKFELPQDASVQLTSALDAALNAHLLQVTALEGDFGEVVTLNQPISASPQPQKWLAMLEKNMRNTLVQELANCVQAKITSDQDVLQLVDQLSSDEVTKRSDSTHHLHWLLRFPSQCVLVAEAVLWAREITDTLVRGRLNRLSAIRSRLNSHISDLSCAIRKMLKVHTALNPRLEVLLAALLTQATNHRDTVTDLINDRISSVNSFEWQSELKQEMDIECAITPSLFGLRLEDMAQTVQAMPSDKTYRCGLCKAQQLGSSFCYGYEYLGPSSRLLVTPLTRRCFLSLTTALRAFKCGTTLGPDGTGKTETIRELSKALGRHQVMFDCTEALVSSMLVRFLTGMLLSGSWVCFEDIDLVSPGVLSVFAQHLNKIHQSLKYVVRAIDNQYGIRGVPQVRLTNPTGHIKENNVPRRASVTSLTPFYDETNEWIKLEDKETVVRRRRFSLTEESDIPESKYHGETRRPMTYYLSGQEPKQGPTFTPPFAAPILGNVVFYGELVSVSSLYGCFLTMSPQHTSLTTIPGNMKSLMRPVAMMLPDSLPVVEVWMTCRGFTEAKSLSMKINTFFKMISDQVSCQPQYDFGLRAVRQVIHLAAVRLRSELRKTAIAMDAVKEESNEGSYSPFMVNFERRQTEENSVVHGLFNHFSNRLLTADRDVFSRTVDSVFVHSVLMSVASDGEPLLADEIKDYLHSNGLQVRREIISKALQLHKVLQSNKNVVVLGDAGSGKTTLLHALSGSVNSLHNQQCVQTSRGRRTIDKRSSALSPPLDPKQESNQQDKNSCAWHRLELKVVFPKAFTQQELFGYRDEESGLWQDGLISRYFRDSTLTSNTMTELLASNTEETHRTLRGMGGAGHVEKWLVFDGEMDQLWMENMSTVLDSTRTLCLGNGESIAMPANLSVLFESSDLTHAAPSLVTRCAVVHCPDSIVGWKSVFRTWIKSAHSKWDISNRGLGIISCLMDHMVDSTLSFLSTNCRSVLTADYGVASQLSHPSSGIHEVQTLIRYMSAIFDRHILRDDEDIQVQAISKGRISNAGSTSSRQSSGITASDTGKVISTFAFAFIWAFGGHLHERYITLFDSHARELLSSGPYPAIVPSEGLVYDYHLDFSKGLLVPWAEKPGSQVKTLATSYTIVPELDRYLHLLDLMIFDGYPVLLVGQSGTGKSALIQNMVSPRYPYSRIFMAASLSSRLFQEAIEAKLVVLRQRENAHLHARQAASDSPSRHLPAIKSRNQLFFLDDLHYATTDRTGSQPPLELLRQLLSQGSLYDQERHHYKAVQNIQFIATAAPPSGVSTGGGIASHPLSPRLTRLMTVVSFLPLGRDTLEVIYSSVFRAWLEEFPAYSLTHHSAIAKVMAGAAVEMFSRLRDEFRRSPCHPHFVFTQHDLTRIAQGMMLFSLRARARPRPKARRRGVEQQQPTSIELPPPVSKSSGVVSERTRAELGKEVKKGKSWPTLPTATTANTPAAISPLIRSILRLWCHEHTRVYGDRLLDDSHRYWFASLLHETVHECFCSGSEEDTEVTSSSGGAGSGDKTPDLNQIIEDVTHAALGVSPGVSATPPLGGSPGASATPPRGESPGASATPPRGGSPGVSAPFQRGGLPGASATPSTAERSGSVSESPLEAPPTETLMKASITELGTKGETQGRREHTLPFSPEGSTEPVTTSAPITFKQRDSLVENPEEDDTGERGGERCKKGERDGSTSSEDQSADGDYKDHDSQSSSSDVDLAAVLESDDIGESSHPLRTKVTFDDMKQTDDKEYTGPLIAPEQLAFPGEDLTDIIFCKHFSASSFGGAGESRGYLECSYSVLEQGIKRCLEAYNAQASERSSFKIVNMVTFRDALHHAARISRALVIPGGHALLLSRLGYGRRTLTRLACYAAGYKLMEAQATHFQSREQLRQQIKTASYVAGIQGKPVVLFIPEGVEDSSLEDVNTLMAEGTCPGLYTPTEIAIISTHLLPGGQLGARRTEHQNIAQERYFRRVKSNLHIVVSIKFTPLTIPRAEMPKNAGPGYWRTFEGGPSCSALYRFPNLLTRSCCVDVYLPWPHEALVSIAEKLIDENDPAFAQVPWKKRDRSPQVAAICSIMAHVHLSSRSMVERLYGIRGLKLYSPNTFLDFADLFKKLCDRICTTEKTKTGRLQSGLKRIDEASRSLDKMQQELDQLAPVYDEAQAGVKACQQSVENSQKEYQDQREACKHQEQEIEAMQGPIEVLKREANEEFGKVSPLFEAAWKAINALDVRDIEEIRSYRLPPSLVELVVNSVCLLFNEPQTWEQGKLLLNRENFFKDLEFYDIKNMPDSIFLKLETFYKNPVFRPEIVRAGSVAAGSLCMWVRAVYDYCVVYRALAPKQRQLKSAEAELEKAKSILGEMRVRGNAIKQELEEKIQSYKDSVKHAKAIDKQIQGINSRKQRGTKLVDSMSEYFSSWKQNLKTSKQNLVTAPGDALMAAAAVCYFGPLIRTARDELFRDWLRVCDGVARQPSGHARSLASVTLWEEYKKKEQECRTPTPQSAAHSLFVSNTVPVQEGVSLHVLLSTCDELGDWERRDLPKDEYAVQNALIMRTCGNDRKHCWPLLIDPHGQAVDWIQALHKADSSEISSPSQAQLFDIRNASRGSDLQNASCVSFARSTSQMSQQSVTSSTSSFVDQDDQVETSVDESQDLMLDSFRDGDEETHGDTDSTMTGRTDHTGGSAFTSMTERAFREKLAQEMGIQIESPDRSSTFAPTPCLEISEGQVLRVSADDPQIVSKLRAAVQAGIVTHVSHMERCRWNKSLELLLARQTFTSNNGTTQVVLGKTAINVHPSFRLYLSASVPLFMPGTGLVPLPFAKVCVIDMSLSQEGLVQRLLTETLRIERPEFDGQQRSLDRDCSLHEQQIASAKECVLEKVIGMDLPLLKDSGMLGVVEKSEELIRTADERHHESEAMRTLLHKKRDEFLPVARHGALLYTVISRMHRVRPTLYYFALDSYIRLFQKTITDRRRSKKNMGSAAARAAELMSALTRVLHARISWSLFKGDNQVFSFLLAVETLLSRNQLDILEWLLFLEYYPPVYQGLVHPLSDSNKPDWVTDKAWQAADQLEVLPALSGLKQSIAKLSQEWNEYFTLPPVLLSNTPGEFAQLSMFQKVLLWKVFREDQLYQVCQELILYVVGAAIVQPADYDLREVLQLTHNTSPVVLAMPPLADGTDVAVTDVRDPCSEVRVLAREYGKENTTITVCLGERSQMPVAISALRRGMDEGNWVILQNAHLADHWPYGLVHALLQLTNAERVEELEGELDSNSDKGRTSRFSTAPPPPEVHPDFRLWIITRPGEGAPLPALVIHRGLKLACERKCNVRERMQSACRDVAEELVSWSPTWKKQDGMIKSNVPLPAIYSLALLHSFLLSRRSHGVAAFKQHYPWTIADLRAGVDMLRYLSFACLINDHELTSKALEQGLAAVAYAGHVTDRLDFEAVMSVAQKVCSPGFIQTLTGSSHMEGQTVEEYLQEIPEHLTVQQLGLTDLSYTQRLHSDSGAFIRTLQRNTQPATAPSLNLEKDMILLREAHSLLADSLAPGMITNPPETTSGQSTLAFFLTQELEYFTSALSEFLEELDLVISAFEGRVALTPSLYSLATFLLNRLVPPIWRSRIPGGCLLAPWLLSLHSRVQTLVSYVTGAPPCVYNVAVFAHAQAFLSCVLMDHAAGTSQQPQGLAYELEVMAEDFMPTSPPQEGSGIFIRGLALQHAHWDAGQNSLSAAPGDPLTCLLPVSLLKLVETTERTRPDFYDCPVLFSVQEAEPGLHSSILVSKLYLRSLVDPVVLRQRRVALVLSLST